MKNFFTLGIAMIVTIFILSGNIKSSEAVSEEFASPINISNSHGLSFLPQMVVSGNNVYTIWNDNATGKLGIFFAKSTDGGTSFGAPVNVSKDIGSSASPQFAVTGNDVYVVWQSKTIGKNQINFAKSTDGGDTFDAPVNISNNSGDSSYPKISVSGNNIYVIWAFTVTNRDYDILFTKSTNGGATFGTPTNISNTLGDTGLPQMIASGNNVYVTWENNSPGNFDIFVAKSTDNGNTFALPVNVSHDVKPSGAPQISASGNNMYLSWMDDSPGNYEIFFAKSINNASAFDTPVNISNNTGDSGYPQIAVSGNNIYAVWTDTISNNNYDILFAKSKNNGVTFGTPVNISNNAGASGWAQITVSENIYVIWQDNSSGNDDIFISKSIDGGVTFDKPLNISNTLTNSSFQQMVVSNNTIYAVWQDGTSRQQEILFTKSAAFVPEFGSMSTLVLLIAIISLVVVSTKTIPKLRMNSNL